MKHLYARYLLRCVCIIIVLVPSLVFSQSLVIGYIELPAENGTKKILPTLLESEKVALRDITEPFIEGMQSFERLDVIVMGSGITRSGNLRSALSDNTAALRAFVSKGKTIIVLAQRAENSSIVPWLSGGYYIARTEKTIDTLIVNMPSHILFNEPNKILPVHLNAISPGDEPPVRDAFLACEKCKVLVSSSTQKRFPVLIETGWDEGRVIVSQVPFDTMYAGNGEEARDIIRQFMENVIHYGRLVKEENPPIFTPAMQPPPAGYRFKIEGMVFLDSNENGIHDEGEQPVSGIPVSDGKDIVVSGTEGRYVLPNSTRKATTVFISIPAEYKKTTPFYHVVIDKDKKQTFDFPLQKMPEQAGDSFTFVQLSDVHITTEERRLLFQKELDVINSMVPAPDFIIATGDLVNDATHIGQLKEYLEGKERSRYPIFHVFGNHDRNRGLNRTYNYTIYCGPDYYSFDHGSIHFVVYNNVVRSDRQDTWLEKDLSRVGKNKIVMAFQHYPHKTEQVKELESKGVDYVFSGHWHSTRIERYDSLQLFSIPPVFFGGIDISPAGFMEVGVNGDDVSTTFHPRTKYPFVAISVPGNNIDVYSRPFDIVVEAYNPAGAIDNVRYEITPPAGTVIKQSGTLTRSGRFTWRTTDRISDLSVGEYELHVSAQTDNEQILKTRTTFNVKSAKTVSSRPRIQTEWKMFMGSPEHKGIANETLRPPLMYQWSFSTGEWMDMSSPLVAENKIFIATKRLDSSVEPHIYALEPREGTLLWEKNLSMPVEHTLAYDKGRLFAVCQDGTVYALDADTGTTLWRQSLGNPRNRWIYSAPTIKDDVVYCGNSGHFAAIDAASGSVVWTNEDGHDWISSYISPTIAGEHVVNGGVWLSFGKSLHSLYAMNLKTGERSWSVPSVGFHASPSVSRDALYATDTRSDLYRVSHENGTVQWKESLENGWSTTTPVLTDTMLLAGSGQGTVYGFDTDAKTIRWDISTSKSRFNMSPYMTEYEPLLSSPTISGGIAWFASGSGQLLAIKTSDGTILWHHTFGAPVISTPTISGNCLYVCTATGTLYCLTSK